MRVKILSSGSEGNCYLISDNESCVILEAGVSVKRLKVALNFDLSKVAFVLVSHIFHQDHGLYTKGYLDLFKCYSCQEGFEFQRLHNHFNAKSIKPNKIYSDSGYRFMAFDLKHDVRNYGYLLTKGDESIVFITDTESIEYVFDKPTQILIELNYSDELIDHNQYNGKLPSFLADRIRNSHLSLEQVKEFLLRQDLTKTKNIILLHLSNRNSNALEFKKEIEIITGKMVHIAESGMEIDLNGF